MNTARSDEIFAIEGSIQAIRLAAGVRDLVEDITNGAFCTSIVAGMSGEYGVMANSASLAMNEGEDVEHLALLVNDTLAVGTFEWLRDLKVDDLVTLVDSRIVEGPLFVHAILRKNDQQLWMPYGIDHTRRGWLIHGIKLGALGLSGSWLLIASFYLFGSRPEVEEILSLMCFTTLIVAFAVFMSTRSVMGLGVEAEKIFRALNVPQFERFRIKHYSLLHTGPEDADRYRKGHIFRFSDALAAHKKKFNLD
jgi:hypothetical protein